MQKVAEAKVLSYGWQAQLGCIPLADGIAGSAAELPFQFPPFKRVQVQT